MPAISWQRAAGIGSRWRWQAAATGSSQPAATTVSWQSAAGSGSRQRQRQRQQVAGWRLSSSRLRAICSFPSTTRAGSHTLQGSQHHFSARRISLISLHLSFMPAYGFTFACGLILCALRLPQQPGDAFITFGHLCLHATVLPACHRCRLPMPVAGCRLTAAPLAAALNAAGCQAAG